MNAKELGEQPAYPNAEYDGLSKREAFAMAAMQGILSCNSPMKKEIRYEEIDAVVSREAVRSADALLEALTAETK